MCNYDKVKQRLRFGLTALLLTGGLFGVATIPARPTQALVSTGEFTITGTLPDTNIEPPTGEIEQPNGGLVQVTVTTTENATEATTGHNKVLPQTNNQEWWWLSTTGLMWLASLFMLIIPAKRRRDDDTI